MRRHLLSKEEMESLAACETCRDFILLMMDLKSREGQPFTYARLSRLAGLGSRSYIRDVITGAKRLNPKLVLTLSKALGLTGDLRSYFEALAERDEEACRISGRSTAQFARAVESARKRLLQREKAVSVGDRAFAVEHLPLVYAALGDNQHGASIGEISKRTGLGAPKLLPVLERMKEMQLIRSTAGRYFATENHFSVSGLSASEVFRQHFISSAENAVASIKQRMASDDALFFSSSYSVRSDRLADLKADLRALLLRYVDVSEDSIGDRVVSLTCAMH